MTDYRVYVLSRRERFASVAGGMLICFLTSFLLYRNIWIAAALCPIGSLYPKLLRERLRRRRQERLRHHFKDALHALSSLLAAGRSVENAFYALEQDLIYLIGDKQADLLRELRAIANRLRNGDPLETPLKDWAERSGLEEIASFADVFAVCKRSGGDLVEVVRRTSHLLGEKMEVEQEMNVLMAGKRFEARILMAMPFAFVGLLGMFAPDYMSALQRGAGLLVLTAALSLLGVCCRWMYRIMDIRV